MAALISALHRCAQVQLPVTVVGAGLPQLRGRMGEAKSYAERLQLAASAGLNWSMVDPLSEPELEQLLVKRVAVSTATGRRVEPDCAWIHQEMPAQSAVSSARDAALRATV
jgi:hypothetical protein